jgi:membrane protease YdiL (CAAX protease family)
MVAGPLEAQTKLEAGISIVFLVGLALTMSNHIPFWNGMTGIMLLAAVGASVRLSAAAQQIFAPKIVDTGIGLLLAVVTWGAVRLLWAPLMTLMPGMAGGLVLVGGYAASQPLAWAAASTVLIAVSEELVWRRYLMWRIETWGVAGPFRAAIVSACAYAAMHLWSGQIFLAAPALGFGLAWGFLSAWRGGPWAAIIWHVGFDILVFLVAPPPVALLPGI